MSQAEELRRVFIALDLPTPVKGFLKSISETLSTHKLKGLRVVDPDNFHLTLRFLGKTSPASIAMLAASLEEITTSFQPFFVRPEGVDVFPKKHDARVLWIGIGGDFEALHSLRALVEGITDKILLSTRRSQFHPHITLARFTSTATAQDRSESIAALTNIVDSMECYAPNLSCGISLIQSTLTPRSASYIQLHNTRFRGQ
jgi:2'-5' RNA ligase